MTNRFSSKIPSLRAGSALDKLGRDISIARRRRRFTQQQLAEGAGVGVTTIHRLEKGDAGVSLGALAMVLLVLGECDRISGLLDIAKDDIGLTLGIRDLPKRVRHHKVKPVTTETAEYDGEGF